MGSTGKVKRNAKGQVLEILHYEYKTIDKIDDVKVIWNTDKGSNNLPTFSKPGDEYYAVIDRRSGEIKQIGVYDTKTCKLIKRLDWGHSHSEDGITYSKGNLHAQQIPANTITEVTPKEHEIFEKLKNKKYEVKKWN